MELPATSPIIKKAKRIYRTKAPVELDPPAEVQKTKCDSSNFLWTEQNLAKLIDYLRRNGFHGEYDEIRKMFPVTAVSEGGLQKIFSQMSRWSEPIKDDPKDKDGKRRSEVQPSPVEDWILTIRECVEAQRFASSPSLILKWIATFEEHPDPASCCDVDYKAIYMYLSSLTEASIPPQLNPPSALKLMEMFDELIAIIKGSISESQEVLLSAAKLAVVSQPIQRIEKNKILRERRRAEWTEEEERLRTLTQSEDLIQVKKVYCNKPGVNPFSFTPDM